jgi:signal transduction histidine kinase
MTIPVKPESDLLIPYWLRTVRVGVVITGLVVAVLMVPPFLPHGRDFHVLPYIGLLAVAAAGGALVALLPWKRLFTRGTGVLFMYAWSAADILLVSGALAVTGGGRSELFLIYALTTVFFGAYPVRGQVSLLLLTLVSYLGTVALTGWNLTAVALFVRLAMLALLALLASFLSRELMGQMEAENEARERAERWASLLASVTAAGREMTLEWDRVIDVAIDATLKLGFEGASLCAFNEENTSYRVVASRGLPEEFERMTYSASTGITGLVRASGRTEVMDDYTSYVGAIPSLREAGFGSVVAVPVWVDGWMAAVLLGGSREERPPFPQEVDALELLASHTSLALQNARRYQEELTTVERLQELDRMKSDFLATVSHELRTPVTVIQGVGLTLEKMWTNLEAEVREELLRSLNANAKSLEGIITTLLDFSRLETGHIEVNFSLLDVTELLTGMAVRLGGLFNEHLLGLDVEAGLTAHADAVLIERVVENLLSNAAKHTPPGTRVTLSGRREGDGVVVAVFDNGPGIPGDELLHLGERFFRGGDLNTRSRGLGLGLALVREMLELHQVALEVSSDPGRGSRFAFRLRAAAIPSADPSVPAAERS